MGGRKPLGGEARSKNERVGYTDPPRFRLISHYEGKVKDGYKAMTKKMVLDLGEAMKRMLKL